MREVPYFADPTLFLDALASLEPTQAGHWVIVSNSGQQKSSVKSVQIYPKDPRSKISIKIKR